MDEKYTLSIKVALPGTPLMGEDGVTQQTDDKTKELKTSSAGHMWYSISDGNSSISYGFAAINHKPFDDGEVSTKDDIEYHKPYYIRTMEITKEQYDKLNEYGRLAKEKTNPDFDMKYNGLSNSCVDFTWKALNNAGIQHADGAKFEGDSKPANNIDNIKNITAPFPNSELNKEENNDKPSRTLMQKILSENKELNIEQVKALMTNDISYEDLMQIGKKIDPAAIKEYLNSDPLYREAVKEMNELTQNTKHEERQQDNQINLHRA